MNAQGGFSLVEASAFLRLSHAFAIRPATRSNHNRVPTVRTSSDTPAGHLMSGYFCPAHANAHKAAVETGIHAFFRETSTPRLSRVQAHIQGALSA
jgi:hypothetical protein